MQRKIIHIDMDCFYAAIEIRDNPGLQNLPVAVGGSAERRGVLCTCNYIARQYGVRSAMPTAHALRLCPSLVVLPVDMQKYLRVSETIISMLRTVTSKVEPISLDEAFLDVSDCTLKNGSATLIARDICIKINEKTQLAASAGVAPNKFLAKIASDWNKPNGLFVLTPADVDQFVKKLPVHKIFGVGKVTAKKMTELNLATCADLQMLSMIYLRENFGRFGENLYQLCRGIDAREVTNKRIRKSLSVEETFSTDLKNEDECVALIESLYARLKCRLNAVNTKERRSIKSLVIKIKYNDFSLTTAQLKFSSLEPSIFEHLFRARYRMCNKPVRLLGLGIEFNDQNTASDAQLSLF